VDISLGFLEIIVLIATFAGMLMFGRTVRSSACRFCPTDPATVFTCVAISVLTFYLHLNQLLDDVISIWVVIFVIAYFFGYCLGDFSWKGIFELTLEKKVNIEGKRIAYYYNTKLKCWCIQIQSFWAGIKRYVFRVHHKLDMEMDRIQTRTSISLDNEYFSMKLEGAMTYVLRKIPDTIKRGFLTFNCDTYKYVPADITELGPYDFFMKTDLYLSAIDIADAAEARRIAAEIKCRLAASEGGATILTAIEKMSPEDAAATLKDLNTFVKMEDAKTTAEAAEKAEKEEPKEKRRWPWSRKK